MSTHCHIGRIRDKTTGREIRVLNRPVAEFAGLREGFANTLARRPVIAAGYYVVFHDGTASSGWDSANGATCAQHRGGMASMLNDFNVYHMEKT